jgi:hypothetical protein
MHRLARPLALIATLASGCTEDPILGTETPLDEADTTQSDPGRVAPEEMEGWTCSPTPWRLVKTIFGATGLAQVGDDLVYSNEEGRIILVDDFRVSTSLLNERRGPSSLVAAGDDMFAWLELPPPGGDAFDQVWVGGASVAPQQLSEYFLPDLIADDGFVYISDVGDSREVRRVAIATGDVTRIAHVTLRSGLIPAAPLALDDTHVYWASLDRDGHLIVLRAPKANDPGFSVDEGWPTPGSELLATLPHTGLVPVDLAVMDGTVYVAGQGEGEAYIFAAPSSGGELTVVVDLPARPIELAAAGGALYWLDGDGDLLRWRETDGDVDVLAHHDEPGAELIVDGQCLVYTMPSHDAALGGLWTVAR